MVFNTDCQDQFYFDIFDHMIHVQTGFCVTVVGGNKLGLDNTTCDTKFNEKDSKPGSLREVATDKCVNKHSSSNDAILQPCGSSSDTFHYLTYLLNDDDYQGILILFFTICNKLLHNSIATDILRIDPTDVRVKAQAAITQELF